MSRVLYSGFNHINFINVDVNKRESVWKKGRNLVQSGHVINVLESVFDNYSEITAKVIRQTSINSPPYIVSLQVNNIRNVESSLCNCLAGISSFCKHIAALVVFVNLENGETKTSQPCEWKNPVTKHTVLEKYQKGVPFTELFGKETTTVETYTAINVEELWGDLKNINCSLSNMLKASLYTMCREILDKVIEEVVNSTSNVCDLVEQHISVEAEPDHEEELTIFMFSHQQTSQLLNELHSVMSHDEVNTCCKSIYEKMIQCDAINVCTNTCNSKTEWKRERQFRITASRAYALFTFSKDEWNNKLEKYFWPKSWSNKFVNHGIMMEPVARDIYRKKFNVIVYERGLVIAQLDPWLAASPDGLVMDNCDTVSKLLEIKCPYKGKQVGANDILPFCDFLTSKDGNICLKKKHTYYNETALEKF